MTGIFAPGGVTGLAPRAAEHSYAPLDWLLQHPMTRRWWTKAERHSLAAIEAFDTAIDLEGGFEGILLNMLITGKAGIQGPNQGTAWRLLINRVPYLQTLWQVSAGTAPGTIERSGRFDLLEETDGMGASWGKLNIYLEENALLEIGMNNNGGTLDPMGWVCWGAYWPTTLRAEYDVYRRAASRRLAGSDV
jgi:hypothetical protein